MTAKTLALVVVRLGGVYLLVRAIASLPWLASLLIQESFLSQLPTGQNNHSSILSTTAFLFALVIQTFAGTWVLWRSDEIALRLIRGLPESESSASISQSDCPAIVVGAVGALFFVLSISNALGAAAHLEPIAGSTVFEVVKDFVKPNWLLFIAYALQGAIGLVLFARSRWFFKAWRAING